VGGPGRVRLTALQRAGPGVGSWRGADTEKAAVTLTERITIRAKRYYKVNGGE